jgi:hypothetical protein
MLARRFAHSHSLPIVLNAAHGDWTTGTGEILGSGRPDRSEELYREALEIDRRLNNKPGMAFSLAGLGASAVARQDTDRGVRILGAAERLAASTGAVLPPHEERWWKDRFATAVQGNPRGEELLAEGRALSLEDGIALALE